MKTSINIFILFLALACNAQDKNSIGHELSLNQVIDSLKVDKSKISILIDKSDYMLYVRVNDQILKEYPA